MLPNLIEAVFASRFYRSRSIYNGGSNPSGVQDAKTLNINAWVKTKMDEFLSRQTISVIRKFY